MNRTHRLGWWAFAGLLAVNVLTATLRPADAQYMAEPSRRTEPSRRDAPDLRGRCVGIAAAVAKDGNPLVYRAFEDGTVEERRAEGIRDAKVVFAWRSVLQPPDGLFTKP